MRDNERFLGDDVHRPYYMFNNKGEQVYSYIDVVCSNFDIGNECQIAVYCEEQAAGLITNTTIEEIEKIFWIRFLKEGLPFINYHYTFNINKNVNKIDFFYWLESSFVTFKKDKEYWNTYTDAESFEVSEKYLKEWIEERKQLIKVTKNQYSQIESLPLPQVEATNTEQLKDNFRKYGFFELPLVKALSEENRKKLIEFISSDDLPYRIAMLDYVGFIKHLEKKYFNSKNKLYKGIATMLTIDERSVKGNILVLNPQSKEDRERYTSHKHQEKVEKNYLKIK